VPRARLDGDLASEEESTTPPVPSSPSALPLGPGDLVDPYEAANTRLSNLLSGVGGGEDELYDAILTNENPWVKTGLVAASGVLVGSGSFVICGLCQLVGQEADILGGATLTLDSLAAAAVGLVAGLPLAGLRAVLWGKEMKTKLPAVEKMLDLEQEYYQPVLEGLSDLQVAIVMTAEVLPTLLIVLPAAQSGLTFSYSVYTQLVGALVGKEGDVMAVSESLALLTTAALSAIGQLVNGSINAEQKETIDEALKNSERYYKLTWLQPGRTKEDAEDARKAFEYVARTYVDTWQDSSRLTAIFTAGEVIYLGLLWRATGDLWAPFVCTMLPHAVDFYFVRKNLAPTPQ